MADYIVTFRKRGENPEPVSGCFDAYYGDSDGPDFISMNLRVTYGLPLGARARADLVAEAFNLFNRVNYDVTSVQGGQYLSGPTLQNPAPAPVTNTRFGQYTATLPPFEAQLGVRFVF